MYIFILRYLYTAHGIHTLPCKSCHVSKPSILWYPRWILVALIVGSLMLSLSPRPMECFLPEASAHRSCGWRWCCCRCRCLFGCGCRCRCRCCCCCCCCCRCRCRCRCRCCGGCFWLSFVQITNQWDPWTQESRRYENARPDSSKLNLQTSGNFRVQDTVISIPSRFSPHPRSRRFGGRQHQALIWWAAFWS